MWFLFPIFFISESIFLSVGKKIGTKLHKTSVKYSEIFQENFAGLIHHTLSTVLLSYIMYYNNWCLNNNGSISSTRINSCFNNSFEKQFYFILVFIEASHYIASICHTICWKQIKRTDQTMHFAHHIITLFLIYGGTNYNIGEFGTIYVLFTHNLCDIPIHIYLLLKNLKTAGITINDTLVSIIDYINGFLLIIMWFYLRLYMFGTFVIYLFTYPEESDIKCQLCVFILYIFDVIWFYLSLKGVYNEIIVKSKKSILYDSDELCNDNSDKKCN